MATAKEREDIQQLKTDVAVIKTNQDTQGKTLERMEKNIEKFAFVAQKEYDKDMLSLQGRVKVLEDYNDKNNVGTTFATLLGNKSMTVFIALLIAAALWIATKGGAV